MKYTSLTTTPRASSFVPENDSDSALCLIDRWLYLTSSAAISLKCAGAEVGTSRFNIFLTMGRTSNMIGSVYEHYPIKTKNFPLFHPRCRFTDDTVFTIAIAKAVLDDRNYLKAIWNLGGKYPHAGFVRLRPNLTTDGATDRPCGSARSDLLSTRLTPFPRKQHAQLKIFL